MNNEILIREATEDDTSQLSLLFYETIIFVNSKDYNSFQIQIWSSGYDDFASWRKKMYEQSFYVAMMDKIMLGFASITRDGYLDYMYVHKDFQGQGIATGLLARIEEKYSKLGFEEIWSDVSLTARPFFLNKGFHISRVYSKEYKGATFENTIMKKPIRF